MRVLMLNYEFPPIGGGGAPSTFNLARNVVRGPGFRTTDVYVEELTYEEMAEITGDSVSALKMRVKRACDRLRQLLEAKHV